MDHFVQPLPSAPASGAFPVLNDPSYPFASERQIGWQQAVVAFYVTSGVFWLVLASLFWWLNTAQAMAPNAWYAFPDVPWLTYGRVFPAFTNAFVFGWASLTGLGVAFYFLGRLSRLSWQWGVLLATAGLIWDLVLALGLWHILGGGSTGRELLEIHPSIACGFFLAAGLVSVWLLVEFWAHRNAVGYVSLWYLLAAVLAFLWVFSTGEILINIWRTGGAAQPAIQSWYVNGIHQLWLVPLALAVTYFLIPEGTDRPVYSRRLSLLGFWGYTGLAAWAGLSSFLGGPFPAWMSTVTIVANVLLLIPVLCLCVNFHFMLKGQGRAVGSNLSLRFVTTGFFLFVAAAFWTALVSFRSVDSILHFTLAMAARSSLLIAGFVSFTLSGAVYYVLPRLLRRAWLSPLLVSLHFWFAVIGLGLLLAAEVIGGMVQGFGLADPKVDFAAITDLLQPFLLVQVIAVGLLFVAHVLLAISVGLFLVFRVRERHPAAVPEARVVTRAEVPVA
ncbi:MAG TPA: cbb3-type cytochrome c oxidase subunit I [Chthoniobacterales bacterium]